MRGYEPLLFVAFQSRDKTALMYLNRSSQSFQWAQTRLGPLPLRKGHRGGINKLTRRRKRFGLCSIFHLLGKKASLTGQLRGRTIWSPPQDF